MLANGEIPSEVRKALQEVRDDIMAIEFAVEAAATAVEVARMEDQAETIGHDRELLQGLIAERAAAAQEVMRVVRDMGEQSARFASIERKIVEIVGMGASVLGEGGFAVNPATDTLLNPNSFCHRLNLALVSAVAGWTYGNVPVVFNGYDLALDAKRESALLLDYFDTAAPDLVRQRMQRIGAAASDIDQPEETEQEQTE
jgi:hypothetical protein